MTENKNVILSARDIVVEFDVRDRVLTAIRGVSLDLVEGEVLALVGESGSGKSTTGKSVVGLENVTSGSILYEGVDITKGSARRNIKYNQNVQMIFQDSLSSLNPRKRVLDIIAEPLRNFQHLSAEDEKIRVLQLLDTVGLNPESLYKYPHQFSGGQRQRIGIARAVATNPKLIIADEPVSALDLSVQAQVLNFMKKIQREFGISYLFISHDLGVVRHMCQNIAIMNKGRLVEVGTREDIYEHPMHIYTKRLLAAIPEVDVAHRQERQQQRKEIEKIYQEQSSQYYDKDGLAYPLIQVSPTHFVALPEEKLAKG